MRSVITAAEDCFLLVRDHVWMSDLFFGVSGELSDSIFK
jgi:hypothetical protein